MAERATCHLLNMKKKLGKFSPTFFCTYLLQLLSVSSLPSTSVLPSHVLVLISPGFSPPSLVPPSLHQQRLCQLLRSHLLWFWPLTVHCPPHPQDHLKGAVHISCQPNWDFSQNKTKQQQNNTKHNQKKKTKKKKQKKKLKQFIIFSIFLFFFLKKNFFLISFPPPPPPPSCLSLWLPCANIFTIPTLFISLLFRYRIKFSKKEWRQVLICFFA